MIRTRVVTLTRGGLARGGLAATLVAGLLSLGATWHTTAQTAQAATVNCTVNSSELPPDQEEQNLLNLINSYRTQPYTWSNTLSTAAVWMGHDMADHNYVGNIDSLGRDVRTRTTDCGYSATAPVGEDVAAGMTYMYGDLSTLSNWMFDPAQWDLIVNPTYTMAGIARAYGPYSTDKWYWVLVVGTDGSGGSGGSVPPAPTATAVPPTSTPTTAPAPPAPTSTPTDTTVASATPTSDPVLQPTPAPVGHGNGNGNPKHK